MNKKLLVILSCFMLAFGFLIGCSSEGDIPTDSGEETNIEVPSSNDLPSSGDTSSDSTTTDSNESTSSDTTDETNAESGTDSSSTDSSTSTGQ